jgi:peptidyl-prolyl cis-trans isomerase D
MAVINKIRQNVGLVIILIGLALFAFIMTDLFRNFNTIFGASPNLVGEVGGTEVDYTYFNTELQNAIYQEQRKSNSQTVPDDVRQNLVNRAWESVVNEIVMNKEYESAGILVSSGELMDMFAGPDPSPIIIQQFAQGGQAYNQDQMKQLLARSKSDPEVKNYLAELEKYMVSMRLQEKYMNVVRSGMMVSRQEAKNAYMEDNRKVSFAFVGINYSSIPDTAVEITDDDIRRYLAKNKEAFRVKESEAEVKYVPFYKVASAQDTADALNYLEKLKPEFLASTNDSLFVSVKSDQPFDTTYRALGEMNEELRGYVKGLSKDSVLGPIFDGMGYRLMKISDIKTADKPRVKVNHLMVMVRGFTKEDTLKARNRADSLLRITTTKNFEEQVAKASDDNPTVNSGGSLGWYNAGNFGGEFDEKIFDVPVDRITLLKSDRGFHIVWVEDKSSTIYQLAEVVRSITPSSNTLKALYKEADKFAGAATESGDFDGLAKASNLSSIPLPPIAPSRMILPGMLNTGELVRWSLTETPGKISGVIETGDAFVIAWLVSRKEEGYMSVEDIRKNMDRKIMNAKKAQMLMTKLEGVDVNDFGKVQNALGRGAFISQADEVSFASATAPGIGNDPIVVGRAFAAELNQSTNPIKGETGVYVIKVSNKVEPNPPSDGDLANYQQNLASTKANTMASKVYLGARDNAKIKDYRFKFGF